MSQLWPLLLPTSVYLLGIWLASRHIHCVHCHRAAFRHQGIYTFGTQREFGDRLSREWLCHPCAQDFLDEGTCPRCGADLPSCGHPAQLPVKGDPSHG